MCSISWKFALIKQFNLWLDKARVPVMKSAESSGTINQRLIVDNLRCVMELSTTSTHG